MSKLLLDNYTYVRGVNASSTDFTVGTLVYVSNWINSVPQFDLAISTDSSKYANGMVLQTIPVGGTGRILTEGKIKLDNKDSSLQEGDILYLSNVAGEYTTTAPSDVYKVGEVIKDNTNDVTVFFSPDFLIPYVVSFTDELAQDAVGNILVDSSTIDFTYSDGIPSITAKVKETQVEIDFGTLPVAEATFTIVDVNCTIASKVMAQVAYEAPTGKDLDEIEMDDLLIKCKAESGQFKMWINSNDGSYLHDKFLINYLIG